MSHFAKVHNGIVTQILVAEQDFVDTQPGTWVQTSYNTRGGVHYAEGTDTPDDGAPLRKNFAGLGYVFDSARDAFYAPQPYPSWNLIETSCFWEAPVAYPSDGKDYVWSESDESWIEYSPPEE